MSGTIEGNSSRSSGSVTAKGSGITTSSGDPTVSTNPSSLGTMFVNTTSGETYVCSDITAGANVWKNVGDGTGDIEPFTFQGTQYGYMAGGNPTHNVIQKYSFSADQDATDVGDLTSTQTYTCGSTAVTHGYKGGANSPSQGSIEKWSYSTDGDSTDVGDLVASQTERLGSSSNGSYGFWHGSGSPYSIDAITKSSWASDGDSVDTGGDLISDLYIPGGHSSATYGYASGGGNPAGAMSDVIQKYSFSISSGTASDVGDLTTGTKGDHDCQSSTDYGYAGGSSEGAGPATKIDRFAFASDGDSTDWGTLGITVLHANGTSSTTHGYTTGSGHSPYLNHIQKIAFASAGTAADIGDLTNATGYAGSTGSNY